VAVKFATRVRFAVAVKLKLALVETAVPPSVQLVNVKPVAGVATTVTDAPELNVPPPLVVPPLTGFELVVIVNVTGAVIVTGDGNVIATPSTVAEMFADPAPVATMFVLNVPVALVVPDEGVNVTPARLDESVTGLLGTGLPN
jgi:hypothetical protein